jgi:hypothetical protein
MAAECYTGPALLVQAVPNPALALRRNNPDAWPGAFLYLAKASHDRELDLRACTALAAPATRGCPVARRTL